MSIFKNSWISGILGVGAIEFDIKYPTYLANIQLIYIVVGSTN